MALVLYLDKVNQAQINQAEQESFYIRRGLIKGLKGSLLPANQIFWSAVSVSGMPVYNDAAFSGSQLLLKQRIFETQPGNSDKVWVTLIYRTPGFVGPPVTFVLSRSSTLVTEMAEFHPGTKKPIEVWTANPVASPSSITGTSPVDNPVGRKIQVAMPWEYPVQELEATAWYREGPPPDAMISALGSVNSKPWRGLPIGFWKYARQSDVTRDYGNSYTITLGLQTRINRDWSEFKFLRNLLQNFVAPKPADLQELIDKPYAYDVFNKDKVTKVGMFPVNDFGEIFGFGDIGMPF